MTRASDTAKLLGAGGSILGSLDIGGGQIGGRRNIIINGAMGVSQRATSATGVGSANGYFALDRWKIITAASAGRLTMTQTADGPSGFANCLKLDCTTADTSIAAAENLILTQVIEGQDLQQLKKGTSDAEKITLSFYVKGNANATYSVEIYDGTNDRRIGQTFSVTTDWTRVILTFPGDTTDALADSNAAGFFVNWWLHAGTTFTGGTFSTTWADYVQNQRAGGTTSFYDSTDRTFFLTGVQLELGSVATPFEHRSFGEELALCQRYYFQEIKNQYGALCSGRTFNSKKPHFAYPFPVAMRTLPAVAELGTGGLGVWYVSGSFAAVAGAAFYQEASGQTDVQNVSLVFDAVSALTDAAPIMLAAYTNDDGIGFDAEL